jgi:hypothetical protein
MKMLARRACPEMRLMAATDAMRAIVAMRFAPGAVFFLRGPSWPSAFSVVKITGRGTDAEVPSCARPPRSATRPMIVTTRIARRDVDI